MKLRCVFVLWIASVTLPALGQSQLPERYILSESTVARALSAYGIATDKAQISLAANVVATEPDPALDVLSVAPPRQPRSPGASETQTWIKLACHVPSKCLPFYAMVTGLPASVPIRLNTNSSQLQGQAVAIKAGRHATLLLDDNRAQIQVSVVSLENGIPGHRIRVATLDRKHIYVAEVVSAQLLKGSF